MSKGPVLKMQFPTDIDWHSWIQHWDKISDYFGWEQREPSLFGFVRNEKITS